MVGARMSTDVVRGLGDGAAMRGVVIARRVPDGRDEGGKEQADDEARRRNTKQLNAFPRFTPPNQHVRSSRRLACLSS